MANPTTNYGFVLPTSTDLVTDLPADFDVALQGVDTRLKALQPGTTLGDLAYSSATANTNTRLAIGSTGNVLTVSGGVPTWAAPSSGGGLTLLSTTTLSGSSTTISSISGSYKNLLVFVKGLYGSTNDAGSWMRFNGDSGATQYAMNSVCNNRGTIRLEQTVTDRFVNFIFSNPTSNTNVAKNGTGTIYIPRYTDTSATYMTADTMSGYDTNDNTSAMFYQGIYKSSAAITSITFGIYVGTFSGGTVYIYGEN